ncbi:hypothetical protein AJ79_07458 [Helicocarpus griseus UAMH5409]|uniref:Uncharacterized protein n=1 Tax=Helicocarpus griseus UAMH5409 TaxID=1447875 RepID=A0A2B7X2P9_9EURO|nr:hypothetical protein AJ79_07458 [Helicocarpus griseus UAMH5409]
MPYATHWTCCKCNFGPMTISNYPSCINCNHRQSSCCQYDAVDSTMAHIEGSSPYGIHNTTMERSYPAIFDVGAYTSLPLPLSGAMKESLENFHAPIRSRPTDLYICCACGDGPKVFQNQGRCVNCDHDACAYCTHVK